MHTLIHCTTCLGVFYGLYLLQTVFWTFYALLYIYFLDRKAFSSSGYTFHCAILMVDTDFHPHRQTQRFWCLHRCRDLLVFSSFLYFSCVSSPLGCHPNQAHISELHSSSEAHRWLNYFLWLARGNLPLTTLPTKFRHIKTMSCPYFLLSLWHMDFQGFRGLPIPVPTRVIGHLSFEGITGDCGFSAMAHVRPSSILSL